MSTPVVLHTEFTLKLTLKIDGVFHPFATSAIRQWPHLQLKALRLPSLHLPRLRRQPLQLGLLLGLPLQPLQEPFLRRAMGPDHIPQTRNTLAMKLWWPQTHKGTASNADADAYVWFYVLLKILGKMDAIYKI